MEEKKVLIGFELGIFGQGGCTVAVTGPIPENAVALEWPPAYRNNGMICDEQFILEDGRLIALRDVENQTGLDVDWDVIGDTPPDGTTAFCADLYAAQRYDASCVTNARRDDYLH